MAKPPPAFLLAKKGSKKAAVGPKGAAVTAPMPAYSKGGKVKGKK
jgi:hypothetical protein